MFLISEIITLNFFIASGVPLQAILFLKSSFSKCCMYLIWYPTVFQYNNFPQMRARPNCTLYTFKVELQWIQTPGAIWARLIVIGLQTLFEFKKNFKVREAILENTRSAYTAALLMNNAPLDTLSFRDTCWAVFLIYLLAFCHL